MSHRKRKQAPNSNPWLPSKRRRVDDEERGTNNNNNNDSKDAVHPRASKEWWNKQNTDNAKDEDDAHHIRQKELLDYFANIDFKLTNEAFDDDEEDEQLFVNNILHEIQSYGDTVFIFEHPDISKVLEKLIQILSSLQIRQFIQTVVLPHLYELITKKCASHVVQTAFSIIPRILIQEHQHGYNEQEEHKDGDDQQAQDKIPSMTVLLSKIVETMQNFDDLSHLFIDEKSTFVLRDLLWISSGVVRFDKIKKNSRMKLHHVRKIPCLKKFSLNHVPQNVQQFAVHITNHLLSSEMIHFRSRFHRNVLCPALEVLIECLFIVRQRPVLQKLIDQIFEAYPKDSANPQKDDNKNSKNAENKDKSDKNEEVDPKKQHIHRMISNESTSHLMQTIFEFGDSHIATDMLETYLNGKEIREIAFSDHGNFVLQSLLRRLQQRKSIQFVASSLQQHTVELFQSNRIGVLVCLLDAFSRAELKANSIVKQIVELLNKREDGEQAEENIVRRLLYLNVQHEKKEKLLLKSKIIPSSSKYSTLGCLLLQSLVKCNSDLLPSVLCEAYLALSAEEIISCCRDSGGSHVIQALIESKYVLSSTKWKFLSKIEDKFHVLCLDKFGNYIMESTFFSLNTADKKQFALKLAKSRSVLNGSRIGSNLYFKMKLDFLQQNERKWLDVIMKHRKHYASNQNDKKLKWMLKSAAENARETDPKETPADSGKNKNDKNDRNKNKKNQHKDSKHKRSGGGFNHNKNSNKKPNQAFKKKHKLKKTKKLF